jgi:hypothetical protein
MIDNQHRMIKGYRELSLEEITMMNDIKQHAAIIGDLVQNLQNTQDLDQRWISIGKTQLQQGFMDLTRGVTKPDFF